MLYYSHMVPDAGVAQWIERLPPEQEVVGSSPAVSVKSRSPLLSVDLY